MKTWLELDVNDKLWLINDNGELIGTTIYKKELGTYAGQDAYGYSFSIEDENGYHRYLLCFKIDSIYEDVIVKKLVEENCAYIIENSKNAKSYIISTDKIKLIQYYIDYEQTIINKLSEKIDNMHKELMLKYKRVDDYKEMIKKAQNDSI